MARLLAIRLGAAACLLAGACGDSASELARRILERHREAARVKPLPAAGAMLIHLAAPGGAPTAARGTLEIRWEGDRYRETVSSGGVKAVRGIQGGKAFLTDEDNVTRVGSEPMLRELITRSYFWRRAYLFEDLQRARLSLGAGDDRTVSVTLEPPGGNPLLLRFGRSDGRLAAVASPRFHLEFTGPGHFRDLSDRSRSVGGEIRWTGLPTGTLPDEQVGGGKATFPPSPGAPVAEGSIVPVLAGTLNGAPVRVRIDSDADGPVRLSPELSARLALPFTADVYGRALARAVRLELPGMAFPALTAERTAVAAGADVAVGAAVFREAVVEWDPGGSRLRFHDPQVWAPPENLVRIIVDDDGNRPVAILVRGSREVRLVLGAETGGRAVVLAAAAGRRIAVTESGAVPGFRWGVLELPPLSVAIDTEGFAPDWGDDGRFGWETLRPLPFYLDMSHRWIYVRAAPGPVAR